MFEKQKNRVEIELDQIAFVNWFNAANDVPDQGRSHALKMMGMALREELTAKQLRYISAYYVDGKTMSEIGALYGVDKSTVSRGIARSLNKIKKVLRYSSKSLLKASFDL